MKKGQRPQQHYRRIRTKRGYRRKLINKNVARITKRQRKIFKHISDPNQHQTEFGGVLDFDKKGLLENIQIIQGKGYDVELPADYEVLYHTHPDKYVSPPTPEDIIALLKSSKQQAEIVFRNGESFTIFKTPETKKLTKLSNQKLLRLFRTLFLSTRGRDWEKRYKKELERKGFRVQLNKNTKTPIKLNVKLIEPRRK